MPSAINLELARSFEDASAALIHSIRQAITVFRTGPPDYQADWESRSTPQDWEKQVLSNLQRYHSGVRAALHAYRGGDIKPITLEAARYKGLSKGLDGYRMDWMTEQNRFAVEEAMDRVMGAADEIHRLGYDELEKAGRL
jgi:hypothetical protein